MKIFFYFIMFILAVYVILFAYLSFMAAKDRRPGLTSGKLTPCPGTPNCVCSEYNGPWNINVISFREPAEIAWSRLKNVVSGSGGRILEETDTYMWSTFRSRIFRFTDDVEFRLDTANKVIHVRSASRAGKGDLGVNKKRVEKLRLLFNRGQVE